MAACCCPALFSCCPTCCVIQCGGGERRSKPGRWKLAYFFVFSCSLVLTWVLRDFYAPKLTFFRLTHECATNACMGKQAVLRVSLGSFLFFASLCVLTLGVRVPASRRGRLHTRGGVLKPLLWAGLVVLCFLPHNSVFLQYFEAARAGGALFLLLQLVIILDLVLTHNEHYLLLDDAASRTKLVLGALVCNAAAVAGIVCMYIYLWKTERDLAFITVTLLLYVLFTFVSLLPGVHAGIFTSGAVGAYAVYLCSTAILSDPQHAGSTPRWLQAVGFCIAMVAIVHSTLSLGSSNSGFDVAPSQEQLADVDEDGEPRSVHPLSYSFFHFVFALGCMYSAMLFSSWSNADAYSQWSVDKGVASMWVKIGCEWAVALLYLWIMLAPLACSGRDFTP